MPTVVELWLPIILAAVFVFVVSSILHMLLPIHRGDYKKLPAESDVLDVLRSHRLPPGSYMFPCAPSMKEMGSPEMLAKYQQGPVGFVTLLPAGVPNIGKNLIQWFVYTVVISFIVAYLASLVLPKGAHYMTVFRVTGTAAMLVYALGAVPESIWKGVSWTITAKFIFDGIVYALVTAGTFGWLWPQVA
ncbi:MAG: hypothetical protein AB7O52_08495 [Planctomycetota bacterium]